MVGIINSNFSKPETQALEGHKITLLNLDTGESGPLWKAAPSSKPAVTLAEKFPKPAFKFGSIMDDIKSLFLPEERIAAHINPLLMPDIKAAIGALKPSPTPKTKPSPNRQQMLDQ